MFADGALIFLNRCPVKGNEVVLLAIREMGAAQVTVK
jgi:hypothetical protein